MHFRLPVRTIAFLCSSLPLVAIAADSCMVQPNQSGIVSGRFGKYREGGANNYGSANSKPHMHDGLDFSTSGSSQPLYATTDGVVTFVGKRGTAGNAVLIQRADGDIVAYYHLSGFAPGLRQGTQVQAGQQIGISGNTPSSSMAKHLHFVYGTSQRDDARAAAFPPNASRGTFNPAQLPSVFNEQAGIGWKTDPAPYFCNTFQINDGHPEHAAILGADTKAQHAILFGSVPPDGVEPDSGSDAVQVAATNADAAIAAYEGLSPAEWLSDKEGYGALPEPPIGGYATMSASEMLMTEATRRLSDAEWNANLTTVTSRALWVDYVRTIGISNYLSAEIQRKKERVEALLAIYSSQKLGGIRAKTKDANARALRQHLKQQVN